MPIQLTYKVYENFLKVEFSGKRTAGKQVEESIRIWKEVVDLCEKEKLNSIMTRR